MVKVLDREAINRMVSRTGSGGVSGGGGGSDIDLTGYATKSWTDDNYVGKDFFRSLFKAYDANGNEVLPNDTETTIDNIKAMFGFWTDFYISALGTGGQSTVGLRLAQLADVNVAGVTNGQVLTYNSTTGKWVAITPQSGTDMATVWANLAANGNQQINASHLTTALTGYATQTWVNSQISDMATKTWVNSQISDMATQTWVGQNYLSKTDAASTYLSIAFFNRLFKAYNGTTQVYPNNTTTAIDNIKAMFGFWTDFYISALGTGGHQSVDLRLAQLADVNVAGVTNGQVLTYNTATGKWIASTPQSGTDMATVWANLATSGNQQINASHLSTALTGYATQTWVNNQISDMATKTWANGQFLKLTGGTLTGSLTVGSDLTVNGGDFWLQEEGGQPRMVFHIPNQNWANITMKTNGEFYLYKTNVETNGLATLNVGEVYANGWIRTYGSYGWYSQSHGGGWYMEDDTWIRSYNGKYVYISSNLASEHIYAGGGSYNANYPLYINGVGYASSGFYTAGYVTALSDERKKDVVGEVGLTVEQIAKARTVLFRWKDKRDNELHMGCIAQDWQNLTPQLVHDRNDELSMEYSVIAAIGTIKNSQRLVNHESRLRRLEKMFALNENDLED